MLKRWFAKYARAVSDEDERKELYKKYAAKTIAVIVVFILSVAIIACMFAFENHLEESWAVYTVTALFFALIASAVVAFILWLSFRKAYSEILRRPARSEEMPEITAYRQMVAKDKKSTFKKLWWAWLVFGICAVAFIVLLVIETIENPDSEDIGVLGSAGTWLLIAGLLTLFLAYFINAVFKQQSGKAIEQQTASEAEAIDKAQGRKIRYTPQSDVNSQVEKMYTYLFPNEELREKAHAERKKRTKIMTPVIIVLGIISIFALVIFLRLGLLGYPLPVMFTILLGGTIMLSVCTGWKLKAIEKEQKVELETNPEYAKHLEWYRLYDNFYKFKGKIYLIMLALGIVLGWVLAILFPYSVWSLFSLVPIVIGFVVNSQLVKKLRKSAIPIENEIDRQKTLCDNTACMDHDSDNNSFDDSDSQI